MPDVIAVFGGVYANHLALRAVLADAAGRGARAFYCLGDLGGFGPCPDKVFPLLCEHGVQVVQGNYDDAVGNGRADCGCGYTDARDNHHAWVFLLGELRENTFERRLLHQVAQVLDGVVRHHLPFAQNQDG